MGMSSTADVIITELLSGALPAMLRRGALVLGFLAFPGYPAAAENGLRSPPFTEQRAVQPGAKRDAYSGPRGANFGREKASHDVRHIADWVAHSGDNRGLPFVIIDKAKARVFVFDAGGGLRGAAPALLGAARGDDSVPGIGQRQMSLIRPHERTTPAGRFVAEHGRNLQGEDIVWVDYDSAVSLHRVRANDPRERRLERLASPTPADNRITYGCVNVPVAFYETVVRPAFHGTKGVVYVLPEIRAVREVFGSYDVEQPRPRSADRGGRAPRVADSSAHP